MVKNHLFTENEAQERGTMHHTQDSRLGFSGAINTHVAVGAHPVFLGATGKSKSPEYQLLKILTLWNGDNSVPNLTDPMFIQ